MVRRHTSTVAALALSAGLAVAALAAPPAAHADASADEFLSALSTSGVSSMDPADAVALGQSICPMLSEPGQTTADVASSVANASGMSLGPATMFTGLAISTFCPSVVSSIGNGHSPLPLSILGF